jgi:RNA exonuclease 4|eukprot:COSAG06_NODE_1579_length_9034_cov_1.850811_3_plen_413_part_00
MPLAVRLSLNNSELPVATMDPGGGGGPRLKAVRSRTGHVSTKQRMKKKNARKQRAGVLQGLASTYTDAAPAAASTVGSTASDERPAKRRRAHGGGRAAEATTDASGTATVVAAPVIVAAGQSNWQRLQKVLPPSRGGPSGKRRRTPGPSEIEEAKEKAKAAKQAEREKEKAKAASGRGGTVLAEEMGAEYAESCVACDCEMVGVGPGGKRSMLARVALVDGMGRTIYDKHVRAVEKVTDYRTEVSGIKPFHVRKENGALPFPQVQREVAGLLEGRLLIGHAVHHDLKSMMLEHPRSQLRDTSLYPPLRSKDGRPRSLKHLAAEIGLSIQSGSHSPVEDALSTLKVYASVSKKWEGEIKAGTVRRSIHPRKSDSQRRSRPAKGSRPKHKRPEHADVQPTWQPDGRFSKFAQPK